MFAGDTNSVNPDELVAGLKGYMQKEKQYDEEGYIYSNGLNEVYEFFTKYVRRIYPDTYWKRNLSQHNDVIWFQLLTPSNIAYVISWIKNGKSMWDQKKTEPYLNSDDGKIKTKKPLFTAGEGAKRTFGKLTWNKEGLKYFHSAERNWREVHRLKEQMSALVNGWERWEPDDDKKVKELLRMRWRFKENDSDAKKGNEEKEYWEEEDGYNLDNLEIDYELYGENQQNATDKTEKEDEEDDREGGEENKDDGDDATSSVVNAPLHVGARKSQRERKK
jgi:hypothetical protein